MEPERVDCWKCSCCGRAYLDKDVAERCCVCKTCGKEGTHNGLVECVECQRKRFDDMERRRWDKAVKVSALKYAGEMAYCAILDEYLSDWDEATVYELYQQSVYPDDLDFKDFDYDKMMVFGTTKTPIALSADRIMDMLNDEAYDGYETDGEPYEALERLCREWNAKDVDHVYNPDYGVAICKGRVDG